MYHRYMSGVPKNTDQSDSTVYVYATVSRDRFQARAAKCREGPFLFFFFLFQALLAALDPLFKYILYTCVFLIFPRSSSREIDLCVRDAQIFNYASFLITFILSQSFPLVPTRREGKPTLHTVLSLNAFFSQRFFHCMYKKT